MGRRNPMKSVKAHMNTKLVKGAEEAQGKQMGQGCLREKGTQEPIGKKAYGRVKPLGKKYTADLKRPGRIKSLQQE